MTIAPSILAVLVMILAVGPRLATEARAAASPPPAPCVAPEHRQFDFWVGDWDVLDAQGQKAGTNSITVEMGGCVLQEHWSAADGTQVGTSFNLYYPPAGRWYQTWVDSTGGFLQLSGGLEGEKMLFTGDMPGRNGGVVRHRLSLERTRPDRSRVRQLWEASRDDGKTWSVVFDGIYVHRKK